jgi:hypothetical protein
MTDWGAHHNDIAQWALGMEESGPVGVTGTGTAPLNQPNCYNCHPTFEVTYVYGNGPGGRDGTCLVCRSEPPPGWPVREGPRGRQGVADNGILFEGEGNRWLWVSRATLQASDRALLEEPLPPNALRLPRVAATANQHMHDFLSCVRSRRMPICDAGIGQRSVTVCHLGVIALRFLPGQTLRWDPREERFTGAHAEAANRHLSRAMRGPWSLDA